MTSTNNNSTDLVNIRDLLPEDIPILPLVIRPIFPNILTPIAFTGEDFLQAIKDAEEHYNGFIGLVFVKDIDDNDYFNSTLYDVGTVVKINKVTSISQDSVQAIVFGVERFKKKKVVLGNSRICWKVKYNKETADSSVELKAYMLAIMTSLKEIFEVNPILKEELKLLVSQASYDHPSIFIDFVSSMLKAEAKDLQELLEEFNIVNRSQRLLTMLKKELEISQLQAKISKQIEDKVSKQQKEYFLKEQLKLIKQELGLEKDEKSAVIDKIMDKINHIHLSPEAEKVVNEQLEKLSLLDQGSPEYHVARTYIESIVELPWGVFSKDRLDIKKARTILDRDHYGLEDIKNSILEFVSTVIKTGNVNGSILCLVGPPGVGKTSIGKSIAESLNRKFYRFSVGGMVDEAEIKGHRRTYIGAMPGKIIQALKLVETSNPVIMIDEIDKIGNSFRGDPASALLEVLDPEQNKDFLDHYLDIRYDLSKILFVTTANQLDTIPRPLLDRMEVIHLSGYILEEKLQIAQKYLIPQQLKAHALDSKEITISKNALKFIIDKYAREAGVRTLDKCIRKIMRKVNLKIAEGNKEKVRINENNVESYLGTPIFTTEELYQKEIPGVTLGLAWTSLGGATLYIEATSISNKESGLKLTGQLGDVMKESAEIAYSYIRSLLAKDTTLSIEIKEFFDKNRVHLHVPEGATPKDGPSAGITMALALYSLATNTPIRKGIAMTGELTLTGKVLPIGGVREKTIAARRVGIFELILPKDNKKDFDKLPEFLKSGITVNYVDYFTDVLNYAIK
ncbi:endopeptidase La [Cetobacterium somerae]|uniref:endopeptidase La n=1 Tax=Cetobacterium sp. NK01 TaxID=2993530 RepID=UPI0021169951|nr:endopeptidase La [Cetobacterium sp. NK01]MCQ8211785.1 endopeptidase La [Cetobacterium sp. NK01]